MSEYDLRQVALLVLGGVVAWEGFYMVFKVVVFDGSSWWLSGPAGIVVGLVMLVVGGLMAYGTYLEIASPEEPPEGGIRDEDYELESTAETAGTGAGTPGTGAGGGAPAAGGRDADAADGGPQEAPQGGDGGPTVRDATGGAHGDTADPDAAEPDGPPEEAGSAETEADDESFAAEFDLGDVDRE